MKNILFLLLLLSVLYTSCKNQSWEFPNYDYQTVYFGHQTPVRTITFGEDIFDTSLDNQGKFQVMATTGGVYNTYRDVTLDVLVDNSLATDLVFDAEKGGRDVVPLPASHYTLASNKIVIPTGSLIGGVEVQLTDAFFEDPLAIAHNYVLPVKITNVTNADSILSGIPLPTINNPHPAIAEHWEIRPKNYTLYAVKYINHWHGIYLRRGIDNITGKAGYEDWTGSIIRRHADVERDELKNLNTRSRSIVEVPLTFQRTGQTNVNTNILLTFDGDNCTVSAANNQYTATGTGKFVKKGEKNSWGQQDRDVVYLEYTIDHPQMTISSRDTLVLRNRGVAMEEFQPRLK